MIGEIAVYLFSKKIVCLGCNGNYKGITERGKKKYVCSNYTNYRNCTRHIVEEGKLVFLSHKHIEIQMLKKGYALSNKKTKTKEEIPISLDQVQSYVSQIKINPNYKTIEILYTDGTKSFISDNNIKF
ncbi:hypothetical protein D3C73_185460 [compost metagenome]